MDILVKVAIVLIVGFIGGKLAKLVKLPSVSGYLVVGLLLGPSLFNLVTNEDAINLTFLSEIALSVIAFSIGSEFVFKDLMKLGKKIFWITLFEVIGAIGVVFVVMFVIFKQPLAFSLVIASMSAATAPAATLLVMRQYRANGPLTRTILPVVALDDVFGIMAFGIALSIAKLTLSPETVTIGAIFLTPTLEIGGSLGLGVLLGLLLILAVKFGSNRDEHQVLALAFIVACTVLAKWWGLSPLLVNIVVGTMVANFVPASKRVFTSVNDLATPLFVIFFTMAGASLDLAVFKTIGFIGIAYVIARAAGKMLGTWFGAVVTKSEPVVRKYMGLAMLPQGGISIGLSVIVGLELPTYAKTITTIIMFSVLIYETSGPIFAKIAIKKAGEIDGGHVEKKAHIDNNVKADETLIAAPAPSAE